MTNMDGLKFSAPDFGSNPIEYLKQVRIELKRVDWPNKNKVFKATILVFAVSVAAGAFLGGLDYIFTILFGLIMK
jgi:preprotein translocase subunit SecE